MTEVRKWFDWNDWATMRQFLLGPRVSSVVDQNGRGKKVVRLERLSSNEKQFKKAMQWSNNDEAIQMAAVGTVRGRPIWACFEVRFHSCAPWICMLRFLYVKIYAGVRFKDCKCRGTRAIRFWRELHYLLPNLRQITYCTKFSDVWCCRALTIGKDHCKMFEVKRQSGQRNVPIHMLFPRKASV